MSVSCMNIIRATDSEAAFFQFIKCSEQMVLIDNHLYAVNGGLGGQESTKDADRESLTNGSRYMKQQRGPPVSLIEMSLSNDSVTHRVG